MHLNLPILDTLAASKSVLIAGAGGGFDIFAGLPIYFTLRALGKTVHLANYSFTDLTLAGAASQVEVLIDNVLIAARGGVRVPLTYLPEPLLAQWFQEARGESVPVWMLGNLGVRPLTDGYQRLVEHLGIDALLLVDGGVDSLMRGDEEGAGTLLEDSISLAAVEALDVPVKLLACIGFGTEVEEQVCHYHALENMAALVKMGAFVGACALTAQMDAFAQYEAACRYVWEQPKHDHSHISTRIIPAVHGEFGSYRMYPGTSAYIPVCLSPLMSVYWFFDANAVIQRNLLLDAIRTSVTKAQATQDTVTAIRALPRRRPRRALPY